MSSGMMPIQARSGRDGKLSRCWGLACFDLMAGFENVSGLFDLGGVPPRNGFMEILRRSIEQLTAPICGACKVEMAWLGLGQLSLLRQRWGWTYSPVPAAIGSAKLGRL